MIIKRLQSGRFAAGVSGNPVGTLGVRIRQHRASERIVRRAQNWLERVAMDQVTAIVAVGPGKRARLPERAPFGVKIEAWEVAVTPSLYRWAVDTLKHLSARQVAVEKAVKERVVLPKPEQPKEQHEVRSAAGSSDRVS